jgi:hypothetical protein
MASAGLGTGVWEAVSAGQRNARTTIVFNHQVKYEARPAQELADGQPGGEQRALLSNEFKA